MVSSRASVPPAPSSPKAPPEYCAAPPSPGAYWPRPPEGPAPKPLSHRTKVDEESTEIYGLIEIVCGYSNSMWVQYSMWVQETSGKIPEQSLWSQSLPKSNSLFFKSVMECFFIKTQLLLIMSLIKS